MNEILLNILSVVVTAVVLPLISFLGFKLSQFLNSKIKDEKAKNLLNKAEDIVLSAVRSTFQTYVEGLKKEGSFDKTAQLKAFNMAKETAINQFDGEVSRFIIDNYGGINEWLGTQIEAAINKLKN